MSSFLFRRRKPKQQFRGHRRLRAEALERRTMLTSVAALPFSIVLLDRTSSDLPPDPCIQFSPQPLVAAATSKMPIQWKGHFSERLQDSSPTVTFEPTAWLVDVVYNLNQEPSPTPLPPIRYGGYSFFVSGTAIETLTPLSPSGNPIATAQVWVSKDSIQSEVMVFPSNAMNPVANNFTFTTDTTIRQAMSPLAAAATTTRGWIANTTTDTTGTIIEAPSFLSGTISLTEQIDQTLSQANTTALSPTWTINAKFVGGGNFQETLPPIAVPSGTLELTGALTGTVSPPKGSLLPTQLIDSQVKASVFFSPTLTQRTIVSSLDYEHVENAAP